MIPDEVDTVVVGAGLAGLAAASTLAAAGRTVLVLEAGDEVGGRTRTRVLQDGVLTEHGGEWIGPQHRHLLRLVGDLDLHLRPAGQLGRPMLWAANGRDAVRRLPPLPLREALALLRACRRLDRMSRTVDPVRPWVSADAEVWDDQPLGAWLREQGVRGDGFRYLEAVLGALLSSDIERVSVLHVLWWLARGNGVLRMLHTSFAYNVAEGTQAIATRLAARLGDSVLLNSPVCRVSQRHGVRVETTSGMSVQARHAVVTAQVGTLAGIGFDPPLPATLAALDELGGRPGTKVTGLLPADHRVRHRAAIGGTSLGGAWRVGRRISGFARPDHADATDGELLTELARLFHLEPVDLRSPTVHRWSEHPYIGCCDIGFAPGQLCRHGPQLATAHGSVQFAGAERGSWPNNMEGAVESGLTAAKALLG